MIRSTILASALFAVALVAPFQASARSTVDGGSGLLWVDDAWSFPISGMLVGVHGAYYTNNFTPGSSRLFTVSPSLTKGLGGGFEASGSWPIEGLSIDLEGEDFARRFDTRLRNPRGKLRYSAPLWTPRMRLGAQGSVVLPIMDKTRPGGTLNASNDFDVGIRGLWSADVGGSNTPVRVHVNTGYWWSRDDGAFYYQDLPTPLPLSVTDGQSNDVFSLGVALEAGLSRFNVFAEFTTEQFWGARAEMRGSENLWRLTPGIRTELTSTVGLTGALVIDLSKDSDETAFDPGVAYPDVEFRVGVTVGQVLGRQRFGRAWREEASERRVREAALRAERAAEERAAAERALARVEAQKTAQPQAGSTPPVASATPTAGPTPTVVQQPEPMPSALELRVQEMAARLATLETNARLSAIENRIASLEGTPPPQTRTQGPPVASTPSAQATPASPTPTPPAPQVQPTTVARSAVATQPEVGAVPVTRADSSAQQQSVSSEVQRDLETRIAALQAQFAQLSAAPVATPGANAASGAATTSATPVQASAAPTTPQATTPASAVLSPVERELLEQVVRLEAQVLAMQAARAAQPVQSPTSSVVVVPAPIPVPAPAAPAPAQLDSRSSSSSGTSGAAASAAAVSTTELAEQVRAELERSRALRSAPAKQDGARSEATRSTPASPEDPPMSAAEAARRKLGMEPVAAAPAQAQQPVPLAVGQTTKLFEFRSSDAAVHEAARRALDDWARLLAARDDVEVLVLVHAGSDTDRSAALADSDRRAQEVLEYLISAGARSKQVRALGMGLSSVEPNAAPSSGRAEIQRIR